MEKKYPILFRFSDRFRFAGNGYSVWVKMFGRALLTEEQDGFWMYGVNPGGMAACGATEREAMNEFRQAYTAVMEDIVEESLSFEALQAEVHRFCGDDSDTGLWFEAVAEISAGAEAPDWLPRDRAETQPGVEVCIDAPKPNVNPEPFPEMVLAACA